ncbi:platelet endothelial cell adhesion molecule isoform X3 [Pangasianodon hypophthalmus]|uniref:platelet endothelial cell adhesion molecule isoform X3 n=1 Tax=Pangasianodon hypophthalmus TaxID=310915 RepID=UPI000EFEC6C8|nr:platelet endothelial cell adhesion molecule isoform X3 [Pangasianodon hypophthalmus]XP_053087941.1 platelet endothelial cell adhesion molecule isoform X3 [Pangasianodon hypophthalmus]
MWTIRCPRLLLHLFLLTFVSITCTRTESAFVLRTVTLYVKPAKTVERGSELTLICVAKVAHSGSNSPLLQFSFFKDFIKHNTIHIAQTNTSDQVTYTIPKARASHTGTYQCDVRVMDQYKESSTEEIIVKGLQIPVLSVDKRYVTEGNTVMVTCSAKEESGELTFSIKDGSKEIYLGRSTSGEVQKDYSHMSVGTARLSCSYFINLGSRMLSSNDSNVVSVVVKDLDFTPTITVLPSTEVIEGDSVHITCRVEGKNYSSSLLSLSKGSKLLKTGKNLEYKTVVLAADSGKYECSATVNNVEKNVYANLTVKELFSRPVLNITPAEVFERQQFTVTCTSSEFASERIGRHDVKYSIYRSNQELSLNSIDGTYRAMAHTETNGNYTCKAHVNDTIKWSRSMFFTAKVLVSRPTITVLGEVVLGRPFQIECSSENGSFPITYILKQNQMTLSKTSVSEPLQKAIFAASIQSEKEIGQFTCEAQNNGVDSARTSDALLAPVTVPVEKPILMTLPVAADITEDHEVQFHCIVTKGTPPISFKWYQDENQHPVHTVTVMKNHSAYSISSMKSVNEGRYSCGALNGAGQEEVSDSVLVTVRMARWKKGLIVGTCLLCVTGLVLAVLVMYYRAKRGSESYSPPSKACDSQKRRLSNLIPMTPSFLALQKS